MFHHLLLMRKKGLSLLSIHLPLPVQDSSLKATHVESRVYRCAAGSTVSYRVFLKYTFQKLASFPACR